MPENIPPEHNNYFENEQEELSNCCSASILMGDICAECKEHCDVVTEDEEQ